MSMHLLPICCCGPRCLVAFDCLTDALLGYIDPADEFEADQLYWTGDACAYIGSVACPEETPEYLDTGEWELLEEGDCAAPPCRCLQVKDCETDALVGYADPADGLNTSKVYGTGRTCVYLTAVACPDPVPSFLNTAGWEEFDSCEECDEGGGDDEPVPCAVTTETQLTVTVAGTTVCAKYPANSVCQFDAGNGYHWKIDTHPVINKAYTVPLTAGTHTIYDDVAIGHYSPSFDISPEEQCNLDWFGLCRVRTEITIGIIGGSVTSVTAAQWIEAGRSPTQPVDGDHCQEDWEYGFDDFASVFAFSWSCVDGVLTPNPASNSLDNPCPTGGHSTFAYGGTAELETS